VVRLIDNIEPLIEGAQKKESDTRRQIFTEPVHVTMDNYFSGDNILKYLGERLQGYYDMLTGSVTRGGSKNSVPLHEGCKG
jgi:hypothetical protein